MVILISYFSLAFYSLDSLPGEWFGDISNLHEYILDIQAGKWPISYRQGVGPLYHYLVTPLTHITGERYIGYKSLSVFFGGLSLFSIMRCAYSLFGKRISIITGFLTASAFWFLVWARLGNLHAMIPGIVSLMIFGLSEYQKKGMLRYLLLSFFAASSGLFLYLGTLVLPVIFFGLLFILARTIPIRHSMAIGICIIIISGFFALVIAADRNEFSPRGYIGEKMQGMTTNSPVALLFQFGRYSVKSVNAYFFDGDEIFRVNVPHSPHIDGISALFLILGSIVLIGNKRRRLWVFLPLIFLTLPSILPSLQDRQVPSMTRSFGAFPFIIFLIAVGIDAGMKKIEVFFHASKRVGFFCIGFVLLGIGFLNIHKYFFEYPESLPDGNIAYGKIIASFTDTIPASTIVGLGECCWGSWGQPEPKGIYYQLNHQKGRRNLIVSYVTQCSDVDRKHDTVLIFRAKVSPRKVQMTKCFPDASWTTITTHGESPIPIASVEWIPASLP